MHQLGRHGSQAGVFNALLALWGDRINDRSITIVFLTVEA
jgi:hypothetical protein